MPLTAFADNKTAKQTYETAISDNWKTMLKNSIALDTINAENNTHLLNWQDVKNPSDEAVKLVEKIRKLQAEQEEDQESMDRVFSLGDRSINTIMTYRSDIVSIDIDINNSNIFICNTDLYIISWKQLVISHVVCLDSHKSA